MSETKLLSEEPITMVDLKKELDTIKKRDEELNFRANKADEYLNTFLTLDKKTKDELFAKINDLGVSRLKDTHISKIIDLLPRTEEELKTVMQGYTVSLAGDSLKKIIGAINDTIPEKAKK